MPTSATPSSIDWATLIQTTPLFLVGLLLAIYLTRAKKYRRQVQLPEIGRIVLDGAILVTAFVYTTSAYYKPLRIFLADFGIYLLMSGCFVGFIAIQNLMSTVFFSAQNDDAVMVQRPEVVGGILSHPSPGVQRIGGRARNILIIVCVQKDFYQNGVLSAEDTRSLVEPLNSAIKSAEELGDKIVYARDWHPNNHNSFTSEGGPWPKHCVANSPGAEWADGLYVAKEHELINIGVERNSEGYSAFEDARLVQIVEQGNFGAIRIAGIALQYCILATCRDAIQYGRAVVAVEPLIRAAHSDKVTLESTWSKIVELGAIRAYA